MKVSLELDEKEIRAAIQYYVQDHYGVFVAAEALDIEVKSKQNYSSEWEQAAIRLHLNVPRRSAQ